METELSPERMVKNGGSFAGKLALCRICHDEDEPSKMETPCACCGSLKFMVLVVLRHTLSIVLNEAGEYSFTLYTLLMLRTLGILLPMFVMLKACSIIRHHRRHRQTPASFHRTIADEENDIAAHIIRIQ